MSSRNMSLLPRATLHSDSEHFLPMEEEEINHTAIEFNVKIYKLYIQVCSMWKGTVFWFKYPQLSTGKLQQCMCMTSF